MNKSDGKLVFAGDIGGTKTFLGLFTDRGDALELVKEATFINASFSSHEEIIGEFLEEAETGRISSATFGIACPVEDNRCRLTNLPWIVDADEIKEKFGLKKVSLINDLVATAWGIELLDEEDLYVLKEGDRRQGNAALIAAGTGLGEAILYWDGRTYLPSGSEGGHTDFAPRTPLEMELLDYLSEVYGHVSYERVLSGSGLENIYEFLKAARDSIEPEYLKKRFETEEAAPVISSEAMHGEDKNCKDALEIFLSVYGAEAGNLALKTLSVAGVYIGGGIAPKILHAMEGNAFVEGFIKKGRFERLLSRVPVYVIMNQRTGLMGAANHAASLTGDGRIVKRIKRMVF